MDEDEAIAVTEEVTAKEGVAKEGVAKEGVAKEGVAKESGVEKGVLMLASSASEPEVSPASSPPSCSDSSPTAIVEELVVVVMPTPLPPPPPPPKLPSLFTDSQKPSELELSAEIGRSPLPGVAARPDDGLGRSTRPPECGIVVPGSVTLAPCCIVLVLRCST